MNRITSRRAAAALGIAVAIAAAAGIQASSAQTGPQALPNLQNQQQDPQYDRRENREFGGQSDFRGGRGFGNGEDRLERRLDFLHARLRITPAQERAWMAFAAVLQDEAQDRGRNRDFDDRRGGESVLERLEERQHRLAERTAGLDRVIRAVQPLYASFSEDQRRAADRLMFNPERGRGFMRGERGGPDGRFDDRRDRDTR